MDSPLTIALGILIAYTLWVVVVGAVGLGILILALRLGRPSDTPSDGREEGGHA